MFDQATLSNVWRSDFSASAIAAREAFTPLKRRTEPAVDGDKDRQSPLASIPQSDRHRHRINEP